MQRDLADNPLSDIDWDDVRVFLTCIDSGSFRQAAERLCRNPTTISRRIERLEVQLGFPLFTRVTNGLVPTEEALKLVKPARAIEEHFLGIYRMMQHPAASPRGCVRISVTEGLGTFWVTPPLVGFSRQHPELILQLSTAVESADVLNLEAEVSIQFSYPERGDQKIVRLGRLHNYPFASQAYIDVYGMPKNKEDMLNHRIVDQVGQQLEQGAWARHLGLTDVEGIVGIRSNSSTAVLYAVEKGAGIGALPSYASALGADLVPIDIGVHQPLDIWLTYHPDARKTKRIGTVIDWLREIFDAKRYPWFGEEFIHPARSRRHGA